MKIRSTSRARQRAGIVATWWRVIVASHPRRRRSLATALTCAAAVCAIACSKERAPPAPSVAPATTTAPAPSTVPSVPSVSRAPLRVRGSGALYALAILPDAIAFCDGRGPRKLDLATGSDLPGVGACKKEEGNGACAGLALDASVRRPNHGPTDFLDVGGRSYPFEGHVEDCASDGNVIAVASSHEVALVDPNANEPRVLDKVGATAVAVDARWVAWISHDVLQAIRR